MQKLSKLELNWDIALQQYALVEQDQIDWRAVHRGDSLYLSKIFDVCQVVGYSRQASIPSCCLGSPSSSRSAFVEHMSGAHLFFLHLL